MDYMRVSRGQIFMYDPLNSISTLDDKPVKNIKLKGCLQQKERPYLVVSNNKCNTFSNVVTVVPIITRNEAKIPVQVKFFFEDRPQIILVEQICTANIEDLGDYVCTVSDEILEQVTDAIMMQVGYKYKDSNLILDDFISQLNKIIHRISEDSKRKKSLIDSKQIKEVTDNILKVIAENFSVNLENNTNDLLKVAESSTSKHKERKCKYTIEMMEQALSDYEELPISDFMTKYQCSTRKVASSRVYYIKDKLQKLKQSNQN